MKWRILFVLSSFALLILFPVSASAETPDHLWNRVLTELENSHPDVIGTCSPSVWLAKEPFLTPLANMIDQTPNRVACAFGNFEYQRGLDFQHLYNVPPSPYDWIYAYADDESAFRNLFGVGNQVFAVNTWASEHRFRYTMQFCNAEIVLPERCY